MTFSDRERFIYHVIILMTMSNLGRLTKSSLRKNLEVVRNDRCKNLTNEQIEEILLDVEKEAGGRLTLVPKFDATQMKYDELRRQRYKETEFSENTQEEWK
tara:strand:+ start:256 stop:558 length:303 start_codon:yes stop_codon:yes gene_type:complete